MNNNLFKLTYSKAFIILLIFLLSNFFPLIISLFDESILNDKTMFDYLLIIQSLPYALTFIAIKLFFNQNNSDLSSQNKLFSTAVFSSSIALFFFTLMLNEYLIGLIPTKGNLYLENMYKEFLETFISLKAYPAALVFATCIFAPVFEEVLFRGTILKGLLNNNKNPFLAIFFTALLFGLVHGNPWQFIGAFTLGLIMGFIYYRTQSLFLVILIHAINNSIAAYFLLTVENFEIQEIKNISFLGAVVLFLIIIFIATILHLLTNKSNKKIKFS